MCNTFNGMSQRKSFFVPALFFGAPVSLISAGVLALFVPAGVALAVGLVAGTAAGHALLRAL